jgi:hydrogenase-4 component B
MEISLTLLALALIAISGVPGAAAHRRAAWSQTTATILTLSGSVIGLIGGLAALVTGQVSMARIPGIWPGLPLHFRMDDLSAFFTVLIFLMAAAGSVYGQGYWRQAEHPTTGRKLRFLYGLLVASMVMVTLAYDALAFLLAWEIMALTSFFLIATEDHKPECRQAAWIYFVATHIGTLALFAMFALLHDASGTFLLLPIPVATGLGLETAIFLLALFGFGLKAGVMPLHFWLPGAHANAPSHISALLSGVLLKVGIYGLLRILTLLPDPPAVWGVLILILGTISAVLGVAFALGQHDIKRLLAYHSIENIGIILMGLGLAMIGIAIQRPVWVVLGIAGCLLHVWNHGLFKSLLFFSAGSVVHTTGTRDIDSLGGLAQRMPWSAGLFMIGAIAICGLPPLNGFISELLVYLGLLRPAAHPAAGGWAAVALATAALAVVGALAVACFVKVFGAVFLGSGRTDCADKAHESPISMIGPMMVLAGVCALIGIAPMIVVLPLGHAVAAWTGNATALHRLTVALPWRTLTVISTSFAAVLVILVLAARLSLRTAAAPREPTWACAYALRSSRMQYTASSFAQLLVGLLRWVLRPVTHGKEPRQLFAQNVQRHTNVPDFVTDRAGFKAWNQLKQWLMPMRRVQQGSVQEYLLYMLLALFLLLASLIPIGSLFTHVMGR